MVNGNILVVEDERITAKDIKRSLEKVGYYVPATDSTGEDAIKFSEKYKPDLVLMDIKLEGEVAGIDAAETITSKFAIPVIISHPILIKALLNVLKQHILQLSY